MFCPGEVPAATRLLVGEGGKVSLHLLYDSLQDLVVCLARYIGTLRPKFRFFSRHIPVKVSQPQFSNELVEFG